MVKKATICFWILFIVAAGSAAWMQSRGTFFVTDPRVWMFIYLGVSFISLLFYFLNGIHQWGLLFPASIFGSLAIVLLLVMNHVRGPALPVPLLVGTALPFFVAAYLDRAKYRWAWIVGCMILLIALFLAVAETPWMIFARSVFLWGYSLTIGVLRLIQRLLGPALAFIPRLFFFLNLSALAVVLALWGLRCTVQSGKVKTNL